MSGEIYAHPSEGSKHWLHGEEQPQQWREGPKHASVLGMEERRKKRTAAAFLCYRIITVGSWLEPTVIEPNHYWFVV